MAVLEQVREWSDALNAALAVVQVLMIGALAGMRRFFVTPAQVNDKVAEAVAAQCAATDRQDKEIADLGARLSDVESAVKRLPTAADINRLLLMVEGLRGDMRELAARVDGLGDEQAARMDGMADVISGVRGQVERLYDYHLKEK
ncbi:hypothetical protein DSECCO2_425150 [anaerobic digester metagenome]|uniref:DUF2730 domain-containing protein n=1 Tax=Nitratidesulfovibrio liaohensis TaxID=2604158 RepID=A0ABY9R7N7_9BACT|nr:DUF2730 family protein [Nitratidesulfovibrio liaohensis]WMW66645.1 DUF2730 domain-containing protein [Nitratidesulfovibrio liaohensis]